MFQIRPILSSSRGVFAQIAHTLERAIQEALEGGAVALVEEMTERIKAGQAPGGGAQRQNTKGTRRYKVRTLGHSTPLVGAEKILSNAKLWQIEVVSSVVGTGRDARVEIRPPLERRDVARWLTDLGYSVVDLPTTADQILRDSLDDALRRFGVGVVR